MRTTYLQILHEDDALLLGFGHEDTAATEETVLEQKAVNLLILHSGICLSITIREAISKATTSVRYMGY